ncbi:MAG: viroplasmin family protein [Eubacteriales bacterium]|nr:viroplasmin family protein [Eubacteriales bacterium]
MKRKSFYAVAIGRKTGIYRTWEECRQQVDGYPGGKQQGFYTEAEARKWMETFKQPENQVSLGKAKPDFSQKYVSVGLNESQKKALEIMLSGENVFLTGEAGTGKTFLLKYFLAKVSAKNVIVCAPTGIAALQIHGATIHHVFRADLGPLMPDKPLGRIQDAVKEADLIVIDEISMCRFDLFDYVCRSIQEAQDISKRKKQVIVVGDFYQLPPVMTDKDREVLAQAWMGRIEKIGDGFAFLAPAWREMRFRTVLLTEVMRQKGELDFIENLNRIRRGETDALEWFNRNTAAEERPGIFLYARNLTVDRKNREETARLNRTARKYKGKKEGSIRDFPTAMELELCVGTRVMSIVNDGKGRYQNGSLGTVTALGEDTVKVRLDNGAHVAFERYVWEAVDYAVVREEDTGRCRLEKRVVGRFEQLPLKVAFAITIHKSQGQTFDSANLTPECFGAGQLYVALSRVRSAEALYLTRRIEERDMIVSDEVRRFYGEEEESGMKRHLRLRK